MTLERIIGLTGGIASGKSIVGALLAEKDCTVLDADRIVHGLYRSNRTLQARLLLSFGPGILSWPPAVDRKKLREKVFSDEKMLAKLERIAWPYVLREIEERVRAAEGSVVIEASRLYESGYASRLDAVIQVECLPDIQRYRLMQSRGFSREDADAVVELQRRSMVRWPFSDYTIYNSGDDPKLELLRAQVDRLWGRLHSENSTARS